MGSVASPALDSPAPPASRRRRNALAFFLASRAAAAASAAAISSASTRSSSWYTSSVGPGGGAPACPGRERFCLSLCPAHAVAAREFSLRVSWYAGRLRHAPAGASGAPFWSSQYTSSPPSSAFAEPEAEAAAAAAAPRMLRPRFEPPAPTGFAPTVPATPPPTTPRGAAPGCSASAERPAPPRLSPNLRAAVSASSPVSSSTPFARFSAFRCSRRIMRCWNCASLSLSRSRGCARITTPRSYVSAAFPYAPFISRNAAYAS